MVLILFSADYDKAYDTAIGLLKKLEHKKTPVDLERLVKLWKNLRLCRYSAMMEQYKCTITEVCEFLKSDLGVYTYADNFTKHVIFYNDTKKNRGLERFTIAHEIGHFLLGHASVYEKDKKLKNVDTKIPYYDEMEKEASFFARNLLVPLPLLTRVLDNFSLTEVNIELMMEIFGISHTAAENRLKSAELDRKISKSRDEAFFSSFEIDIEYYCKNCKIISHSVDRCEHCNAKLGEVGVLLTKKNRFLFK